MSQSAVVQDKEVISTIETLQSQKAKEFNQVQILSASLALGPRLFKGRIGRLISLPLQPIHLTYFFHFESST